MKNLWKLVLGIMFVFAASGCAHRMVSEYATEAPSGNGELYQVTVKQVVVDRTSGKGSVPVIVLANKDNDRQILPIWVGMSEGISIDMALKKHILERPGTHDLFASVLGHFRMKLVKVVITDLRENTYIATMTVEFRGQAKEIDARPSDAIALALRCIAPIFVSEEVIHKGGWLEIPQQYERQSEGKKEDRLL